MAGSCKVINISRVQSILCTQDEEEMFLSSWAVLSQQWESWVMQPSGSQGLPGQPCKYSQAHGIPEHWNAHWGSPGAVPPSLPRLSCPMSTPLWWSLPFPGNPLGFCQNCSLAPWGVKRLLWPLSAVSSQPWTHPSPECHSPAPSSCLCADPSTEEIFPFLFTMLMRITWREERSRARNMLVTTGLPQTVRQTPPIQTGQSWAQRDSMQPCPS